MNSYENKKKVRIQIDKDSHHQAIIEEKEYAKQKLLPFSKIPAIKHIKEQNVYQFRPNADLDGEYENPSHQDSLNSDIDNDHLDQWKRYFSLKTAQNADELKRMRKNHENSLKFDEKFPQINMEIIDSITKFPNDNQSLQKSDNNITNTIKSLQALSPKSSKYEIKTHSQFPYSSKSMSYLGHDTTNTESSKVYDPSNRIYTLQGQRNTKFIQSNEAIQREVNKKLVNSLIFSRIQRTLEDNQITGKSKNEKSDGVSSINKQRAEDIFKTEMSHFQNQTLANFKNLMNTFRRTNNLIEFEDLSRSLSSYLNRPRGIFGSEQKNELLGSFKDEKEERYHFKHMEKIMLDSYKQLRQDINDNKNKIKDMRQQIFELQNKLSEINEQTRDYLQQVQKEVEQQEKALDNPNKKAFSTSVAKLKASMLKTQENKEEKLQQFREEKDQSLSLLNQYTDSLSLYEREIKNLKDKKNITRNMLKSLYFQTMKSDKTLQKQSMVWIIHALLNINEDITQSDVFPSILDGKSVQYLIDYAALESKLDKIQNQLISKADDPADQSKNDEFDLEYLHHQQQYNLAEYKDKVQKIAKKSNLKIGKPIFSHSHKNEYVLGWERAQDIHQKEEITFSMTKVPQSKIDLINQNKDSREEMKQIMEQQKKMKEVEANRLIEAYLVYKDERKINELNQILLILFGELEGEEYFRQYEKKYLQHQQLVKNNKTFSFTRANLSTKIEKEESISEQRIPIKGAVGSQTILNYRKGIDEDENKQIDQFALVKQVGKTFHKNKQEQNNTSYSKRAEIPQDILEKHNKMKKSINENNSQLLNFNLIYPNSMTQLDSHQKSKNNLNRSNYLFGSFSNLPPTLTNIQSDTRLQKETPSQRSHTQNNFQIRKYKPHTPQMNSFNDLESATKQQNLVGILKNPSSKNFLQP